MKKYIFLTAIILVVSSCEKSSEKLFSKLKHSDTQINFTNKLTETPKHNYFSYPYMYLGGGVSVGDINNDGFEDIFFTGNMVSNKYT